MSWIGKLLQQAAKQGDQIAKQADEAVPAVTRGAQAADEGLSMSDVFAPQETPDVAGTDMVPMMGEGGPPPGGQPPPGTPPSGGQPPMEPPPPLPGGMPPEDVGLVMPQTLGGSTRKLPNADYFTNPDTQELIRLTQRAQVLREGKSWKETQGAARDVAAIQDLHGKPPNERWTAAEVTALRMQLESQSQQIKAKADAFHKQKQAGEPLSPPQVAEMQQLMDRLAATEDLISGAAHEAGQLLNALKIPVDSDYAMARAIAKLTHDAGGESSMATKVAAIAEAKTLADIIATAREGWAARTWRGLLSFRYNMMLSSIRSHGANVLGSAMTGAYETAVIKNLTAVNSLVEASLTGTSRAVTFGDNWRGLTSLVQSTGEAFRLAKDIAAGRTTPDMAGKFLNELGMRVQPIRKLVDPIDPAQGTHPLTPLEKARLVGSTPTRMLEAEDAFFRTTFYNQRLGELLSQRARALHPGDPDAQAAAMQSMFRAPPEELREEALRYSQKLTFTNDPSIYGKFLGAVGRVAATAQRDIPGMQLLMPFVRTPANIMSYSMEQLGMQQVLSPNRTWRQLTGTDKAARAEALARIEAAVGVMALAHWMVNEGDLTGIMTTDHGMRKMYEAQGAKPNSIRIYDEIVDLSRLDPIGLMLGVAASGWEIQNEVESTGDSALAVMSGAILSMSELLLDRSYLSSFGEFFSALQQGTKGTKPFLSTLTSIVASFAVPGIARDFREMTDPARRAMDYPITVGGLFNRIMMQIKNGLPVTSQGLPNAVDVKGDLIINGGNFAVRGLLPMRVSTLKPDATLQELVSNGLSIDKPKPFVPFPGGSGKLGLNLLQYDPEGRIYAEYQSAVNRAAYEAAKRVVDHPAYQRTFAPFIDPENAPAPATTDAIMPSYGTPTSDAAKLIRGPMNDAKEAARLKFLQDLGKGKFASHLVKGETVTVPAPMIEISNRGLRPLIVKMRKNEPVQFEEIPGLMIKPSAGKNIPKMLQNAPEFE